MFIVETDWLDPSCSWLNHHVSPCLPVSQLVHAFRPRSTWRASGLRSSVARRQWGDASPFRVTRQKPWCRGFTHWDCRMGIYPLLGGWDSAINCPLWPQHEHMNNHPVWTIHLQKTMKTFTPVPIPGSWSTFQLPNLTCPLLLESRMMRYCNVTHVILMFIAPKDAGIWYWEYQPTRRGCCAWWLLISSPFAVYGTIDAISAHCCGWDPPNRLILGYSLPRCNGTFPDFPANHVFFSPAIAVSSSNARARARRRWSSEPPMKPEKPFRCSTGARANRRGRSKLGL